MKFKNAKLLATSIVIVVAVGIAAALFWILKDAERAQQAKSVKIDNDRREMREIILTQSNMLNWPAARGRLDGINERIRVPLKWKTLEEFLAVCEATDGYDEFRKEWPLLKEDHWGNIFQGVIRNGWLVGVGSAAVNQKWENGDGDDIVLGLKDEGDKLARAQRTKILDNY